MLHPDRRHHHHTAAGIERRTVIAIANLAAQPIVQDTTQISPHQPARLTASTQFDYAPAQARAEHFGGLSRGAGAE
jgi:hypothetical protein